MFRTVKAVMISALLGAGALSLAPASAQADSLYFSLGVGDPRGGVVIGEDYAPVREWDRRDWDRRDWDRRDWRRPGWDRPPPRESWDRPGCSERHALRKAYRMGLDRPFIARDNRRMIVVAGVGDRGREWIRFARVPGCPVIR